MDCRNLGVARNSCNFNTFRDFPYCNGFPGWIFSHAIASAAPGKGRELLCLKRIGNNGRGKALRQPELGTGILRAALLSFAMLAAIAISGLGIYGADASADHAVVDGYGVIAR